MFSSLLTQIIAVGGSVSGEEEEGKKDANVFIANLYFHNQIAIILESDSSYQFC